jgi:hypothetical protein
MNIPRRFVIATALLTVASSVRGAQDAQFNPQQDLLARIGRVVGPQARNCGQVNQPGNWGRPAPDAAAVEAPIDCSIFAASQRQPFFMVLRTAGFDSWTAMGLMGGPDGILQSFTYDSLYGQGVLRASPCPRPRGIVNPDGFVLVTCDPQQANLQMQPTRRVTPVGARLIWRR